MPAYGSTKPSITCAALIFPGSGRTTITGRSIIEFYSPVVLIEFDHQPGIVYANDEPTRDHVHTAVRTPNGNDYGKDLLRQHYARHDHSHPHTAHRRGKE